MSVPVTIGTARRSADELRDLVARGTRQLRSGQDDEATPDEILAWVAENFRTRDVAVASSMANGALAHLASQQLPGVDVLFLDTGYHFAETLFTRDEVAREVDVNVIDVAPARRSPSRMPSTAQSCSPAIPDSAARCARSSPCASPSAATRCGSARRPPRGDRPPHAHTADQLGRAQSAGEGAPDRRLDLRRPHRVRVSARRARQPADRERVPVDRLRPVHEAGRCRRRPRSGRWAGLAKTECGLHL